MTIASLPPSNYIKPLQAMLDRMKRNYNTAYGLPTRQELEHAQENLDAIKALLEKAPPLRQHAESAQIPTSDDIIKQRDEEG